MLVTKSFKRFIQSHRDFILRAMTHTERTKDNYRSKALFNVTVTGITNLSETVKGYELSVTDGCNKVSFLPGQWLDVHIPTSDNWIGGYSITSSPDQFNRTEKLGLAIQYSDHPPTDWMHSKCKIGTKMKVQVGGDFFYDPSPTNLSDLLLIAGGIGINPIYSILKHQCFLLNATSSKQPCKNILMFSARNSSEFVFKEKIDEISTGIFKCQYYSTRKEMSTSDMNIYSQRITESDICKAVQEFEQSRFQCYLCGPPPFINNMTQTLLKYGVEETKIHYEKWW